MSAIWLSRIMQDSTRNKNFDFEMAETDLEKTIDAQERNSLGEPLPEDRFPKKMWNPYKDGPPLKKQAAIINAGGFWVVTRECANVLREFDLGGTRLYPTALLQRDRETEIDGSYFCLSFGEQKTAHLPAHSERTDVHEVMGHWLPIAIKHDEIAVSARALEGADLWIDPSLRDGVFLSGHMAQALRAAKMARAWGLRTCRVVD